MYNTILTSVSVSLALVRVPVSSLTVLGKVLAVGDGKSDLLGHWVDGPPQPQGQHQEEVLKPKHNSYHIPEEVNVWRERGEGGGHRVRRLESNTQKVCCM